MNFISHYVHIKLKSPAFMAGGEIYLYIPLRSYKTCDLIPNSVSGINFISHYVHIKLDTVTKKEEDE